MSFRQIVNEAIRTWLEQQRKPSRGKPYRTKPHAMGVKRGMNLDNIQELLAEVEGEDAR